VQEHLVPRSASSLRHAVRAVRGRFLDGFFADLARLERDYLHDLMATHDAREGIEAFVQKRRPAWSDA
jgi:cyclohexa-1,5-dienecarbonyl-CoA hydratase